MPYHDKSKPPRNRVRTPKGDIVDGMLLLDKAEGLTSNQALQNAKRLLNARKAGHTGSLDPIATGVLPLCFGETTKTASFFLHADKRYEVRIRLGQTTDSGDREGKIVSEAKVAVRETQLQRALAQFRGAIKQVPPMFSALKKDGKRLYKLARQGISVEREPRDVTVHELTLKHWEGDLLDLELHTSHGFYVRALAADLGEVLGCGGHVQGLRRTAVAEFLIQNTYTLAQLEAIQTPIPRRNMLLSTEDALQHFPEIRLPANIAAYLCRGKTVRAPVAPGAQNSGLVRVYGEGVGFLGVAELQDDAKLIPQRLFYRI